MTPSLPAGIHGQWLPDEIRIENGISPDTVALLEGLGHRVVTGEAMGAAMGAAQPIVIDDGLLQGAANPRRETSSALGL